jgi:hypothetical protein
MTTTTPRRSRQPLAVVDDLSQVTELQRGFAMCHADGHEWRHQPGAIPQQGGVLMRTSTCSDCGTRRESFYPRSGAAPVRRYRYPDGYLKKSSEYGLDRKQWRRVMIVGLGA